MWRELIRELVADVEPIGDLDRGPEFFDGATPADIESVERQLGVQLPDSLRELLTESNGVFVIFGTHLIWSTDEVLRRNLEMRSASIYHQNYTPVDNMLFFADAGVDGIQFAFTVIQGAITREDVYTWDPIEDSRELKAPSLRTYIEGWLSGQLTV